MPKLTEEEASANLERAISDWAEACGWNEDNEDFPNGWVLLVEYVSMDDPGVGSLGVSHSDGMTLSRQLGFLDYAHTLARRKVRGSDE